MAAATPGLHSTCSSSGQLSVETRQEASASPSSHSAHSSHSRLGEHGHPCACRYDLQLDFLEAVFGTSKEIEVDRLASCTVRV